MVSCLKNCIALDYFKTGVAIRHCTLDFGDSALAGFGALVKIPDYLVVSARFLTAHGGFSYGGFPL